MIRFLFPRKNVRRLSFVRLLAVSIRSFNSPRIYP